MAKASRACTFKNAIYPLLFQPKILPNAKRQSTSAAIVLTDRFATTPAQHQCPDGSIRINLVLQKATGSKVCAWWSRSLKAGSGGPRLVDDFPRLSHCESEYLEGPQSGLLRGSTFDKACLALEADPLAG